MDQNSGNTTIGRQEMQQEEQRKNTFSPFEHRWLTDPAYQESQLSHGWTLEYCKYFDNLKTVNMDYIATWCERARYHNMLVLRYNTEKITCCGQPPGKKIKFLHPSR